MIMIDMVNGQYSPVRIATKRADFKNLVPRQDTLINILAMFPICVLWTNKLRIPPTRLTGLATKIFFTLGSSQFICSSIYKFTTYPARNSVALPLRPAATAYRTTLSITIFYPRWLRVELLGTDFAFHNWHSHILTRPTT